MNSSGIVTLTTDFGTQDPYVGIMKGVIYGANPRARIVDVTHNIPAHDIVNAAFTLARACPFFPEGTVHAAVVDPEVGGSRRNVAILTERYCFVGPDNGIFAMVLEHETVREMREIKNPPFVRDTVSHTFHGRDFYAPCAGLLSAGKDFSKIGPEVKRLHPISYPRVTHQGDIMQGEVVCIDSFGSLITNISEHTFKSFVGKRAVDIYFAADRFNRVHEHYSEVPKGQPLLLFGSSGYLEVAVNSGSAARYYLTSVGNTITVRRS